MNKFKENLSEKSKRKSENLSLIAEFYERKLTKEEEEELLKIGREQLDGNKMFQLLLDVAQEYIQKGKVTEETLKVFMQERERRISLKTIEEAEENAKKLAGEKTGKGEGYAR